MQGIPDASSVETASSSWIRILLKGFTVLQYPQECMETLSIRVLLLGPLAFNSKAQNPKLMNPKLKP